MGESTESAAEGSELRALRDLIDHHPGTTAHRNWDALTYVHGAFVKNEQELLALLAAIEVNDRDIALTMASNVGPEGPRREFYTELFRLLHNYVASAVTLIDHTRKLVSSYAGTPMKAEYEDRIQRIRDGGLGPFIAKLRVYVVHVGLPAVGVSVRVENGVGMTTRAYVARDRALEWDDWPADARAYLEQQAPQLPLRALVVQYGKIVEELYGWFYAQFPLLHATDIREVNALIRRTPGGGRL